VELSGDLGATDEPLNDKMKSEIKKLKHQKRSLSHFNTRVKHYKAAKQMESLVARLLKATDLAGPARQKDIQQLS